MAKPIYLVLEQVMLVATDLALTIQDFDPAATVLIVRSTDEALMALEGRAAISIAFVHCSPAGFCATDLGKALADRGALCVFMGNAAEHTLTTLPVLHRPFATHTVMELLQTCFDPSFAGSRAYACCTGTQDCINPDV